MLHWIQNLKYNTPSFVFEDEDSCYGSCPDCQRSPAPEWARGGEDLMLKYTPDLFEAYNYQTTTLKEGEGSVRAALIGPVLFSYLSKLKVTRRIVRSARRVSIIRLIAVQFETESAGKILQALSQVCIEEANVVDLLSHVTTVEFGMLSINYLPVGAIILSFPNIDTLILRDTLEIFEERSLNDIQGLKNLKTLILHACTLGKLPHLNGMDKLETLDLSCASFTRLNFAQCARTPLQALTTLRLRSAGNLNSVRGLHRAMPNLRSMQVEGVHPLLLKSWMIGYPRDQVKIEYCCDEIQ